MNDQRQAKVGDYVSEIGNPDLIGKVISVGGKHGSLKVEYPNSVIPKVSYSCELKLRSVLDILAAI